MPATALSGGFDDPAIRSARVFRSLMQAMARPGRIERVQGARPPAPVSNAAGAILLTLCDADTPVHLAGAADCDPVRAWLAFHTGAPIAEPSRCLFALGTWDALSPLARYPFGTPDYPDRSATLIVESACLAHAGASLSGPGIETRASLTLPEIAAFRDNAALFPLGLDFLFTCGGDLAALPRTTQVSECMSQ